MIAKEEERGGGESLSLPIDFPLSYTTVYEYASCPKAFYLRYILCLPTDMPWELFFGRCFHRAIEEAVLPAVNGMGYGSPEKAAERFAALLEAGVSDEDFRYVRTFTTNIDWAGNDLGRLLIVGMGMVKRIVSWCAENVANPTAAEIRLRRKLPVCGISVDFESHIDLMTSDCIYDFKSSRRPWTQSKADAELQPKIYMMMADSAKFTYVVVTKSDEPMIQTFQVIRDDKSALEAIEKAVKGMLDRNWEPTPSWRCAYCRYLEICEEGKWKTYRASTQRKN